MSTRRQALKPLSLKDGTRLETGDWACTPVRALMQTPEHYPQPLEFHGFRFVEPARLVGLEDATLAKHQALQPEPSKLTDVGGSFHVWGTGRMAWYVTALLTQMQPHCYPLHLFLSLSSVPKHHQSFPLASFPNERSAQGGTTPPRS